MSKFIWMSEDILPRRDLKTSRVSLKRYTERKIDRDSLSGSSKDGHRERCPLSYSYLYEYVCIYSVEACLSIRRYLG